MFLISIFVAVALADPSDFVLQLLSDSSSGKCLDGSPAGFYIRQPPKPSASWIIHFEGGGWCVSEEDCALRAQMDLGSSKKWPPHILPSNDGGAHGVLSTDMTVNPRFYESNMVRFEYCDGASYAGSREDPISVNGTDVFFRGRQIIEDSFEMLKNQFGLGKAQEVIVTGCSAGGLAVYLHVDWIRSQFPKNVRVVGIPDSGFFMDLPDWTGTPSYSPLYKYIFGMQNATFINEDCLNKRQEETWKCFMAQYTLPFIKTPLFIVNPLVDSWQMGNIVRLECLHGDKLINCSKQEMEAVVNFQQQIKLELSPSLENPQNGAFAFSCVRHCGACKDNVWSNATVSQKERMRDAIATWYDGIAKQNVWIDSPYPTNNCQY